MSEATTTNGHSDVKNWPGAAQLAKDNAITPREVAKLARKRLVTTARYGTSIVYNPEEFEQAIAIDQEEEEEKREEKESEVLKTLKEANNQLLEGMRLMQTAVKDREAHVKDLYNLIPEPHRKLMEMMKVEADRSAGRVAQLESGYDKMLEAREKAATDAHVRELGERMWAAENARKQGMFDQVIKPGAGILVGQVMKMVGIGGVIGGATKASVSASDAASNAAPRADGNASSSDESNAEPAKSVPQLTPEQMLERDGEATSQECDQIEALGSLLLDPSLSERLPGLQQIDILTPYQGELIARVLKHRSGAEYVRALRLLLRTPDLGIQLEGLKKFDILTTGQGQIVDRILRHSAKAEVQGG